MINSHVTHSAKNAIIATAFIILASVGALAGNLGGSTVVNSVPNMVPVRDLVATGQAKFQVVDKQVFTDKTVLEVVLVDADGKTIGGYAPPYLSSQAEARGLWKDFVSANLSIPAMPDQMTFAEDRKAESESFSVGFVLDHSASMTIPRAIRMQKSIQAALRTFDPLDYASVTKFTGKVKNEVSATKSREEYLANFKVNGLDSRSDGTAIYDAALKGIEDISSAPDVSRRIMILFTDGEDNSSTATLDQVITAAQAAKVKVFGVTFGVANDAPIEALALATAGKVYRLNDIYDFDKVFLGIYNALRHTYSISVKVTRDFVDDRGQNATMTTSGGSSAVMSPSVMAMLPKENVDVANANSNNSLVLSIGLRFKEANSEISEADVPLLDSVATLLIQRGDIALEIMNNHDNSGNAELNVVSQRRAQSIRDMLVRRGVPPSRVQSYAGKGAPTIPLPKTDQRKTTFVFTKL